MPWERDIYVTLLKDYIEKENLKRQQEEASESMDEEELEQPKKKKITLSIL